jgi:hypothetical protein
MVFGQLNDLMHGNSELLPNLCVGYEYVLVQIPSATAIDTKLSGAAEARRAHNPEDTGSKPVSAIVAFCLLLSLDHLALPQ